MRRPRDRGWDFERVWRLPALVAIACDLGRVLSEQRLEGRRLRTLQEAKLRRLLAHAHRSVPYYRELFQKAGLTPGDVRTLDDLPRVPITSRAELQSQPQEALLSTDFAAVPLRTATTTGSTGRPFTSRQEASFDRARRALFLRALWAGGYRIGMKIVLVDGTSPRSAPQWTRVHYIPQNLPAEAMLDAINQIRPTVLYSPLSPLRQMVDLIRLEHRRLDRPRLVFTTAEILDPPTRRLLRESLGASVFDLYGSTELGVIAWECEAHDGYHIVEDRMIIELVPDARGGPPRIIATSLDLIAMPLIRYETGDRATPGPSGRCVCGRASTRLGRIDGRSVDCVRLRDGRVLSPYDLTLAIEPTRGLDRFQIIQEDFDRFLVRAQSRAADKASVGEEIVRGLQQVLDADIAIRVDWAGDLDPPDGRKFRVVESRI